jgi:cytochrome c oxidase subunit IV
MGKKKEAQQSAEQPSFTAQSAPGEPSQTEVRPTVSNARVLGFWAFLLLLAATAWLLDYFMPQVPERVVERWLLLLLAGFMVYNLYTLRDR